MIEEWRDIRGFEGKYQISSHGRVKSLPRTDARGNRRKEKILKPCTNRGYFYCGLGGRAFSCHRLVAQAFIDNPKNLPQVNHISGNKKDNHWTNLEWSTAKENTTHVIVTGLRKSPKSKTPDIKILEAARLLSSGKYQSEVISITGLKPTVCSGINKGDIGKNLLMENGYDKFPLNPQKSKNRFKGEHHHLATSNEKDIISAAKMFISGSSRKEIRLKTGLSPL